MAVRKRYPYKNVDGAGLNNIIEGEEFYGAGRMFSHIVMEPGAVVDWHEHHGEVEYYYILSGEGEYTDEDRTVHKVSAGDVCTIHPEHGHAIKNTSDKDLEFMALIINVIEK